MKSKNLRVRKARTADMRPLLELYTQLHNNIMTPENEKTEDLWKDILSDKKHHIIVGQEDGKIVSSCVLIIVPNLTQNQRPYALIENVITHKDCRNKGYASRILKFAKYTAVKENCYKIMLMTGSKEEKVFCFYEKNGYNRTDKTAFIQWLNM